MKTRHPIGSLTGRFAVAWLPPALDSGQTLFAGKRRPMTLAQQFSRFCILAIVLLFAHCICLPTMQAADVWSGVERIVAIGDVHGDYQQFVTLLRLAGLIDEKDNWIGGGAHLVQTGDVPDRGPESRRVMELLMKLERQAKKKDGFVHVLIGNHEAMNIYGDLRYVHPGEYAAFRDAKSPKVRDAFYKQHVEDIKQDPPPEGLPAFGPLYRTKWEREHPPGFFEHRFHYGPQGKYGKWIMKHNAVIKINDILFLHGGIGPRYVSRSVRQINNQVRSELADFSKLTDGMVIDSEGPLWYRGLAQHDEQAEAPHLEALLEQHQVKRIVMGHTLTEGTVKPRFGGRVVLIDTGMSQVNGSHLACLLIEGDKFYTIHRGERLELPKDSGESLAEYLRAAAALDASPPRLARKVAELQAQERAVQSPQPAGFRHDGDRKEPVWAESVGAN